MKKQFLFSLLALGVAAGMQAEEGRLLSFPSTNGTDVVFTYAGDLYKAPLAGGEARRLTSHVGYELFARFSPDGRTIAFTGEYDGNREVYLIPGRRRAAKAADVHLDQRPRRRGATAWAPNNIVMAWDAGRQRRGLPQPHRRPASRGGCGRRPSRAACPRRFPCPRAASAAIRRTAPSWPTTACFREFRNWKYYRGGMADDIWVYDPQAKRVDRVTDNVAQDICPMWIGDDIYFISDRDKTMNLFVYHTATRQTEKVTSYTDYDIKFPSTDGKVIVYEKGGYLFRFDPQTRRAEQIHITLNAENLYARPELRHVATNLTAAGLSADGKRLAVTARGEVFDVPAKHGVTRNITRTPGAHERGADWSPNRPIHCLHLRPHGRDGNLAAACRRGRPHPADRGQRHLHPQPAVEPR